MSKNHRRHRAIYLTETGWDAEPEMLGIAYSEFPVIDLAQFTWRGELYEFERVGDN